MRQVDIKALCRISDTLIEITHFIEKISFSEPGSISKLKDFTLLPNLVDRDGTVEEGDHLQLVQRVCH